MVWFSHNFKNLPQLVVMRTIKGFSVVNEAEIDEAEILRNFLAFSMIQRMLAV